MIDAAHGIVDVVRPAVPRAPLQEQSVEPLHGLHKVPVGLAGVPEEVLVDDGVDDAFCIVVRGGLLDLADLRCHKVHSTALAEYQVRDHHRQQS